MALLKIARMGHPVLMTPSSPVEDPTAPEVRVLVRDMIETMADSGGVGLAAPQVHVGKRVVVYFVPGERADNGEDVDLSILINPEFEPIGEETTVGREGCLSLPGMSGMVRRADKIRLRYWSLDGAFEEEEIAGYHARVVQHECDHLDGILYPMRMDDLSTLGFVEEQHRSEREYDDAFEQAAEDDVG